MKAIIQVCKLRKKVLKKIKNIASSQNNFHCPVGIQAKTPFIFHDCETRLSHIKHLFDMLRDLNWIAEKSIKNSSESGTPTINNNRVIFSQMINISVSTLGGRGH